MAKNPRKRQKTTQTSTNEPKVKAQPLGTRRFEEIAEKDDEERKLESLLFGTPFPVGDGTVDDEGDDVEIEVGGGGKEMDHLMDNDLFYIDDGASSTIPPVDITSDHEGHDLEHPSESESGSDSGAESDPEDSNTVSAPPPLQSRSHKLPAWTDPSDQPLQVSLSSSRLRKLRDAPSESTLSGREYETRLRRQFERINPVPEWAAKARKGGKRRRSGGSDVGDEEEHDDGTEDIHDLLVSTSGILAPSRKSRKAPILPPEILGIERLRDANQASQSSGSGEIKVVTFHPSDRVPVLCVGSADRRIRLFNIDGHTSPLLQTLHIPSLPLTSSSASFHPSGSHLLLTGPRPYYYTYDLQGGSLRKSSRGLWGTTFSAVNDSSASVSRGARGKPRGASAGETGGNSGGGGEGLEITSFSPGSGDILAVAGRGGYVHLVDWKSGAGQVVGSLKMGGGGGGVKSLWWAPDNTDPDGTASGILGAGNGGGKHHLVALTGDAEVYLWDVGERRCVRRWRDEGGFRGAGRVMAGAGGKAGGWLAVGSNTGFVNVYGSDSYAAPPSTFSSTPDTNFAMHPKPVKTIPNLTTAISTLRFNHDAQILAIASREKKDAMRLIHLPTLTSFANWPTSSTPLGHVTAIDFSAGSEYLAIGNAKGRVLLHHLRAYGLGV